MQTKYNPVGSAFYETFQKYCYISLILYVMFLSNLKKRRFHLLQLYLTLQRPDLCSELKLKSLDMKVK